MLSLGLECREPSLVGDYVPTVVVALLLVSFATCLKSLTLQGIAIGTGAMAILLTDSRVGVLALLILIIFQLWRTRSSASAPAVYVLTVVAGVSLASIALFVVTAQANSVTFGESISQLVGGRDKYWLEALAEVPEPDSASLGGVGSNVVGDANSESDLLENSNGDALPADGATNSLLRGHNAILAPLETLGPAGFIASLVFVTCLLRSLAVRPLTRGRGLAQGFLLALLVLAGAETLWFWPVWTLIVSLTVSAVALVFREEGSANQVQATGGLTSARDP